MPEVKQSIFPPALFALAQADREKFSQYLYYTSIASILVNIGKDRSYQKNYLYQELFCDAFVFGNEENIQCVVTEYAFYRCER